MGFFTKASAVFVAHDVCLSTKLDAMDNRNMAKSKLKSRITVWYSYLCPGSRLIEFLWRAQSTSEWPRCLFLRYWWSRRANMFKWLGWYLFNKNALTPETGNPRKMYYWSKCTKRKHIKYCPDHHRSVKQNFVNFSGVYFDFAFGFSLHEIKSIHPSRTQPRCIILHDTFHDHHLPQVGLCSSAYSFIYLFVHIFIATLASLVGRTGSRVTRFSRLTTENTQLSWYFR